MLKQWADASQGMVVNMRQLGKVVAASMVGVGLLLTGVWQVMWEG